MGNAGVRLNWGSKGYVTYLSLCNLVVMVGKLEVHTPSVDVSLLAQDVTRGRRAYNTRELPNVWTIVLFQQWTIV